MSDDLINRLRDIQGQAGLFASAAADRIEELEAKLLESEALLAKAVEECACIAESHKPSAALLSDRYWRGVDEAAHSIAYEIYATLAELTGGQKDE